MTSLARAVLGTIRNIPKAVSECATDSDIATLCVELGRVRKELYAELDNRGHRKWTARVVERGRP